MDGGAGEADSRKPATPATEGAARQRSLATPTTATSPKPVEGKAAAAAPSEKKRPQRPLAQRLRRTEEAPRQVPVAPPALRKEARPRSATMDKPRTRPVSEDAPRQRPATDQAPPVRPATDNAQPTRPASGEARRTRPPESPRARPTKEARPRPPAEDTVHARAQPGEAAPGEATEPATRRPRRALPQSQAALAESVPGGDDREGRFLRRREMARSRRQRRAAPDQSDQPSAEVTAPEPAKAKARRDAPPDLPPEPPDDEPSPFGDRRDRPADGGQHPRQRGQVVDDVQAPAPLPTTPGPLIDPRTVAGRSLTAVVAIMTFLSALLVGSALLVERAANTWSAGVLTEVSVTVLPLDGDPIERRLQRVADAMAVTPGLETITVTSQREAEALLAPWLGNEVDLSLLPVPRLVTAERGEDFDANSLSLRLADVPGVSLDDHSAWSDRLARMAGAAAWGTLAILGLMLAATAITVVFATRAALSTNAATIEVLHVLGAEDRFIARAFRRRFLGIGVKGAFVGVILAVGLLGAVELYALLGVSSGAPAASLFGDLSVGLWGYVGALAVALTVAVLVVLTATLSVRHQLSHLEG
ncbi:MAG: hypothetical protein ROR55_23145 [Devosia sp.]